MLLVWPLFEKTPPSSSTMSIKKKILDHLDLHTTLTNTKSSAATELFPRNKKHDSRQKEYRGECKNI